MQSAPPEAVVSAVERLLRHFAIEWPGDGERRTRVEGLLGEAAGQATPSQRLASEMARAIQRARRWCGDRNLRVISSGGLRAVLEVEVLGASPVVALLAMRIFSSVACCSRRRFNR